MPSSISLPSNEELEQILGHLDANNRDTWIMVFNALGKDYPNNDTVFKIAQNWASHAGNRKKTDEKHEKNEFYKGIILPVLVQSSLQLRPMVTEE